MYINNKHQVIVLPFWQLYELSFILKREKQQNHYIDIDYNYE